MYAGAEAAALALGSMYACAGWNKLFHPVRRMEMKANMRRLLPIAPRFFYWFVSTSELGFGLLVLLPWEPSQKFAALALLAISVVAWVLSGRKQMLKTWKPFNLFDHIASTFYSPEPLLATLALVVTLTD